MLKKPFMSVLAPMPVPLKYTLLKGTGSPLALSYTKPFTEPVDWDNTLSEQMVRKRKIQKDLMCVIITGARKCIKLN